MLIVLAIVAAPAAWIAKERRQSAYEAQLAEDLRRQEFSMVVLGGPFDSWELKQSNKPQGWWRDLARGLMGRRIWRVSGPSYLKLHPITPTLVTIPHLGRLDKLEWLALGDNNVRDLTPLSGLTHLQYLHVGAAPVSDLSPLASLKDLQELNIAHTRATDLTPLYGLSKLTKVNLRAMPIGCQEMDDLQKALPNCYLDLLP